MKALFLTASFMFFTLQGMASSESFFAGDEGFSPRPQKPEPTINTCPPSIIALGGNTEETVASLIPFSKDIRGTYFCARGK